MEIKTIAVRYEEEVSVQDRTIKFGIEMTVALEAGDNPKKAYAMLADRVKNRVREEIDAAVVNATEGEIDE